MLPTYELLRFYAFCSHVTKPLTFLQRPKGTKTQSPWSTEHFIRDEWSLWSSSSLLWFGQLKYSKTIHFPSRCYCYDSGVSVFSWLRLLSVSLSQICLVTRGPEDPASPDQRGLTISKTGTLANSCSVTQGREIYLNSFWHFCEHGYSRWAVCIKSELHIRFQMSVLFPHIFFFW